MTPSARWAASLPLLLAACASKPPPPPPAEAPRAYVATTTPAPAPAAPAGGRKANQVMFTVNRADLAGEVLPLFEQQVGIRITWIGDARPVTLRLSHPMDWQEALSLVCQ